MSKYQRSVLVVEDEHFIRALVSDKLTNDGFRVQTASNAREAKKSQMQAMLMSSFWT
jgi:DNA-binding NtrC family response regulator